MTIRSIQASEACLNLDSEPTCKCVEQGYPEQDCKWHGVLTMNTENPNQESRQNMNTTDQIAAEAYDEMHPCAIDPNKRKLGIAIIKAAIETNMTKNTGKAKSEIRKQYCLMCGHIANDLVEHYSQDIETVKEGFALYSKNAHKEMAALQAHADKLAEALREAIIRMDHLLDDASGEHSPTYKIARKALANWEGGE